MNNNSSMIIVVLILLNIVVLAGIFMGNGLYSFSREGATVFKYNKFTGDIFMCRPQSECVRYEPQEFASNDFTNIEPKNTNE